MLTMKIVMNLFDIELKS